MVTTKEEFVGPEVIQPPEGKTPHVKPVEVGGGAQWPSKLITSTPSKDMGSTGDNLQESPHEGHSMLEGEGVKMDRRRNNLHPYPLPKKMVEMEVMVMVMVVVMEMMMGMMMMMTMRIRMMMMKLKQLLRVKVEKIQMRLWVEVHQEKMVVEVMDHHLIQGFETWDLEAEGDLEVKEDEEGGQVHKVYQVYKDHKDLRALRV